MISAPVAPIIFQTTDSMESALHRVLRAFLAKKPEASQ